MQRSRPSVRQMTKTDWAADIRAIVAQEPGITSKALAGRLGLSEGRVSQILKTLKQADVVQHRRSGRDIGLHLSGRALSSQWVRKRWS